MADERLYNAQPERVFAALIHALVGLSARIERVEGFGTAVIFRTAGPGGDDVHRFSAVVLPETDGALLQIHPADDIATGGLNASGPELTPGLLNAVQDRLDRGPQARR
jgi:hypothetical protein